MKYIFTVLFLLIFLSAPLFNTSGVEAQTAFPYLLSMHVSPPESNIAYLGRTQITYTVTNYGNDLNLVGFDMNINPDVSIVSMPANCRYIYMATNTLNCTLGKMTKNQTQKLSFVVSVTNPTSSIESLEAIAQSRFGLITVRSNKTIATLYVQTQNNLDTEIYPVVPGLTLK